MVLVDWVLVASLTRGKGAGASGLAWVASRGGHTALWPGFPPQTTAGLLTAA